MHFSDKFVISSTSEDKENHVPPPKRKKASVSYIDPSKNKYISKTVYQEDYLQMLSKLEECSPSNSQENTHLPWGVEPAQDLPKEEKWNPPYPKSFIFHIFQAVKKELKWTGSDRLMKSSNEMQRLMRTNKKLNIKYTMQEDGKQIEKQNQVTLCNGKIRMYTQKIAKDHRTICADKFCWKRSHREGGVCEEHYKGENLATHFLVIDENSPSQPTYALILSQPHSAKATKKLTEVLKDHDHIAEHNYKVDRENSGTTVEWKILKKWIVPGLENSTEFEQTIRTFIVLLFPLINSQQGDHTKHLTFVNKSIPIRPMPQTYTNQTYATNLYQSNLCHKPIPIRPMPQTYTNQTYATLLRQTTRPLQNAQRSAKFQILLHGLLYPLLSENEVQRDL